MSTLRLVLAIAVLGAVLCSPATAAVAYTVVDLGPGCAYGINNAGQVVGTTNNMNVNGTGGNAFIYSNQTMTIIGPGCAYGINNAGQVVGATIRNTGYGIGSAFLYSGNGTTNLGYGWAYGINNSGAVVGENSSGYAFLDSSTGGRALLGGPSYGIVGAAYGINEAGQVVGQNYSGGSWGAFVYSNGVLTNMYYMGASYAINNAGQSVGGYGTGNALLLYGNNEVGSLLDVLGTGYGINNVGQIVGAGSGGAFLYCNGVMTNLDSLIDPASGWTLTSAQAINDNGQIVGYGTNAEGQSDAFLLDPVPEPATMSLAAVGLAALLTRRKERRSPENHERS